MAFSMYQIFGQTMEKFKNRKNILNDKMNINDKSLLLMSLSVHKTEVEEIINELGEEIQNDEVKVIYHPEYEIKMVKKGGKILFEQMTSKEVRENTTTVYNVR